MKKAFRHDGERGDFLFQLSALLKEGYALSETIQLYTAFTAGSKKEWLEGLYGQLIVGESFSDQLLDASFSKELVSYLLFIERFGDFQKGLLQASVILKKRHDLKQKTKKILHYPCFLFMGFVMLGSLMIEGVLPRFQTFFETMDQELPLMTKVLLIFSEWVKIPLILVIALGIFLLIYWLRRKPLLEQVQTLLKVPLLNNYLRHLLTYYLTSQLAPMLKNGLSLHDALRMIEKDSYLDFFRFDAQAISFGLQAGESFPELIQKKNVYLDQLSSVIALGESKGRLGDELERFSTFLFQHMHEKMFRYIGYFQPIFLCVIGVMILFLFLSMMLPIFSILEGW
ncbi:competence type IV pilus assembly protein ComGB [Salipaludibacillus sp. CF4.18]|uniref:competence type IV pilus assembly protein ComGB n=1 Tax=Salipaludibacillus sp. CF4.18 TaxID=3373081 RepID=UPI003EE46C64